MSRSIAVQFLRQKLEKSLVDIQGLLDDAKILTKSDLSLEDKLKKLVCGYLDQAKELVFESQLSNEDEEKYKKEVKNKLKKRQIKRKGKNRNSPNEPPNGL